MNTMLNKPQTLSGVRGLYFWLNKRNNSLIYDFGIKKKLITDRGSIEYLDIHILNPNLILKENCEIGSFEINKAVYSIINPLKNSNLIKYYNIDLHKLNLNPENTDNKIATFEIVNPHILQETYFKYFK